MEENKYYYGITIGPIIKTLTMTSSPGGLWLASYIFSYISKELISQIEDIKGANILIPASDRKVESDIEEVGSYPDHIIFTLETDESSKINGIIRKTKDKITNLLIDTLVSGVSGKTEELKNGISKFVNQYINIHCIKTSSVNNIMTNISEILDNVEQFNSYIYEEKMNYFLTLFNSDKEDKNSNQSRNNLIKKFIANLKKENKNLKPQVYKKDSNDSDLKKVDDIAKVNGKEGYKISDYLAIVQADGDNMTTFFKDMGNDTDKVKEFSKKCINYTSKAAQEIKAYGGVTIYAGGDDLLFLAPLEGKENKNIFHLIDKIKEAFNEELGKNGTSVSFGIAVNYKKFPLYEAYNKARNLLDYSKDNNKNRMTLSLMKNSGLSVFLSFDNDAQSLTNYKKFIEDYYQSDDKNINDTTNSIIYLMDNYRELYNLSTEFLLSGKNKNAIKNFFENMTDNPSQEKYSKYIERINELYLQAINDKKNKKFESIEGKNDKPNTELSSLLRFAKFFVEQSGRKEMMKEFCVELEPLDSYFFGNERNFGFGRKNQANYNNYYVTSENLPTQTTLLGTLRYFVLKRYNKLSKNLNIDSNDDNLIKEQNKLVGESSFSMNAEVKGEEQQYGLINKISPMFLKNKNGDILVKLPFNQNPENEKNLDLRNLKKTENIFIMDGNEQREFKLIDKINLKDEMRNSFVNLKIVEDGENEKKDEIVKEEDIFETNIKIGINRSLEDDGFFKQERKFFKNYKLCFYVYFNEKIDGNKIKNGLTDVVYMGMNNTAFKITLYEEKDELEKKVKSKMNSKETFYYALSDLMVEGSKVNEYCDLVMAETRTFRSLKTIKSSNDFRDRLIPSNLYNLIKAGSVFFVKKDKVKEFEQLFSNNSYKNAGFNYIVKIGGNDSEN